MTRRYLSAWIAITVLTALGGLFGGHSAASAATSVASDPLATPAAQAELTWLANLPNRSFARRVVSGYFGGYSGTADPSTGKNWASELLEITGTGPTPPSVLTLTGQQPGILACDYGAGWSSPGPVPTTIDTSCDSDLANWARPSSGGSGLVSVSMHLPNPDAAATSPGQPLPSATFEQIYDPTTSSGVTIQNTFNGYLNNIAAGLQVLQSDNIPVLFRPFLEGNGNWFWWDGQTPNDFKALWRYTYNYLTSQKGLHNLLWVYSPSCNGSANAPANPGATADPAAEYPGDAFADIVGLSCYFGGSQGNHLVTPGSAILSEYAEMTLLGKPFAFTEMGFGTDNLTTTAYPDSSLIDMIRTYFPATAYFLCWNGGYGPVTNAAGSATAASALFDDPWVINRGTQIDPSGPVTQPPSALLYGFEGSAEGWTASGDTTSGVSALAGGPWAVTEWATQGSYSLKANVNLAGGNAYLTRIASASIPDMNLSGDTSLTVTAATASWQTGSVSSARIFLKTGSNWVTYLGPVTPVASTAAGGTRLSINLNSVGNLTDVQEIGVEFMPAAGATGSSAAYVDNVILSGRGQTVDGFENVNSSTGAVTGATEGWSLDWSSGVTSNGPWAVEANVASDESASQGLYALKANVNLAGGPAYLTDIEGTPVDMTNWTELTVDAATASWQTAADSTAVLFIQTGPNLTTYYGPTVPVDSNGVTLTLNLNGIANLNDVRKIAVEFKPATGATGNSAIYIDNLTYMTSTP